MFLFQRPAAGPARPAGPDVAHLPGRVLLAARQQVPKVSKAVRSAQNPLSRHALRHGVSPSFVHQPMLSRLAPRTVIDVGANRGQFALDALMAVPGVSVISFEPLETAANKYRQVLGHRPDVVLHQVALSDTVGEAELHVAAEDDCSSLLPIGQLQESYFPSSGLSHTTTVAVSTLDTVLVGFDRPGGLLLKLDVQGAELDVLRGATTLLQRVDWVYLEVSFVELYDGQPLAAEVDDWLKAHGFALGGIGGVCREAGDVLQADLLYHATGARRC